VVLLWVSTELRRAGPAGFEGAAADMTHPARPYDPAFAARVVELAGNGLFRAEIAIELGASLADFEVWSVGYLVFAVALADADTATCAWWDRHALEALTTNKPFRSSLWAKVMAQHFGRQGHLPRKAAEKPEAKPIVRARYEIPDNGKERRPRKVRGEHD
jgi:hypothetical protein